MFWNKPAFWNTEYKKFARVYTEPVMQQNRIYTRELSVGLDRYKTRRNGHTFLLTNNRDALQWLYINILQANSNYVIPDYCGEIYEDTNQYLRNQGYQVHVLNLCEPEKGLNYNPLRCMQLYRGLYTEAIENTLSTMLHCQKNADPFKHKTAETLLRAILYYTKTLPTEQQTTETMRSLLPGANIKPKEHWDGGAMKYSDNNMVHDCLNVLSHVPGIMLLEAAFSVATVMSYIDKIAITGEIFDIKKLASGKHVVYLIYENQPWHQTITAMFYTQLLDALYNAGENSPKHHVEENWLFYTNQWHYELSRYLATSSKYNINFAVHSRVLAELKDQYPFEWEVILGNCDVIMYAPGTGCHEDEYMTRCLRTVEPSGVNNSDIAKAELAKVTPEQCVVCMRGEKPFLCTKYNWQCHPRAMELPRRKEEIV